MNNGSDLLGELLVDDDKFDLVFVIAPPTSWWCLFADDNYSRRMKKKLSVLPLR
jgi:hypothetical protein